MEVHVGIYICATTIYLGPEIYTVCFGARVTFLTIWEASCDDTLR